MLLHAGAAHASVLVRVVMAAEALATTQRLSHSRVVQELALLLHKMREVCHLLPLETDVVIFEKVELGVVTVGGAQLQAIAVLASSLGMIAISPHFTDVY